MIPHAELCVTSNFTFLRGASHPEELVKRAAELGLTAIAITDRNSVAGVVRAFSALKELARITEEAGQGASLPRLIPGARLVLTDSPVEWVALPTDLAAWSRLTRLLSLGKRRAEKGSCHIGFADLEEWARGMVLIALPPDPLDATGFERDLRRIAARFAGQCFLGAAPRYDGQDQERLDRLAEISQATGLPKVAVGDVLMHRSNRRPLADVLTCIREGCTIDSIGDRRLANGEHRLKSGEELARIFLRYPAALRRTVEIADRCAFRMDQLRYQYPDEARDGEPAQSWLERLAHEGLRWRYPGGPPPKIASRFEKELHLIAEVEYAPYFLTVYDELKTYADALAVAAPNGLDPAPPPSVDMASMDHSAMAMAPEPEPDQSFSVAELMGYGEKAPEMEVARGTSDPATLALDLTALAADDLFTRISGTCSSCHSQFRAGRN